MIGEILARVRRGGVESLSSGQPTNTNLAAVAYRYFGSWRKTIEAAKVPRQFTDSKGA